MKARTVMPGGLLNFRGLIYGSEKLIPFIGRKVLVARCKAVYLDSQAVNADAFCLVHNDVGQYICAARQEQRFAIVLSENGL